ncbi:putative DUF6536 domain-containing protein [Seiridium cardinale]
MLSFGAHNSEGWRRTGLVNIILVSLAAALLLGCFIASIVRGSSSINIASIIVEDECSHTSKVNLLLHLAINIVSSGILASSNFYMQVLSAPSRKEIDHAHLLLRSLDIGIPSVKNIRFVSRFKQVCWLVLFLSSFPLHLLSNSAVFETSYQGREWNMTMATEAFTHGATYFPPGASLSPAGSPSPTYILYGGKYRAAGADKNYTDGTYDLSDYWELYDGHGYGDPVSLSDYWDEHSQARQNLDASARDAAQWTRLDPSACLAEYRSCNARKMYQDVVVVIESTSGTVGWTRSEVFHFDPQSDLSSIWDLHVPPNETNSLWYSSHCETTRSSQPGQYDKCENTCIEALGVNTTSDQYNVSAKAPSDSNWTILFQPSGIVVTPSDDTAFGYNDSYNNLNVEYCLVQPIGQVCKIGVSNSLILIILACIILKLATCAIVVWNLPQVSLVTPGDAMESFICRPDPRTEGMGSFEIADSERLEFGPRKAWVPGDDAGLTPIIRPRRWQIKPRRLVSTIPRAAWTRTYLLLLVATVFVMACLIIAISESGANPVTFPFGHSDQNLTIDLFTSYTGALMVANAPQLLLSLCYFSYNTFFTRLAVEKEWNAYSLKYTPLRVSYPAGEQFSHYRLQLPYKYSMPLLAVSVLLHWLVSNTIYIFINEGGYWKITGVGEDVARQFGVGPDAVVALGYSPPAILTVFVVSVVLCIIPVVWSLRKVKGDMISGGTNSLVISAACHAVASQRTLCRDGSTKSKNHAQGGYERIESPLVTEEDEKIETAALRELSRRKLKWGAVPLPADLAKHMMIETGQVVKHLTFGGLDDDVQKPEHGELYA